MGIHPAYYQGRSVDKFIRDVCMWLESLVAGGILLVDRCKRIQEIGTLLCGNRHECDNNLLPTANCELQSHR